MPWRKRYNYIAFATTLPLVDHYFVRMLGASKTASVLIFLSTLRRKFDSAKLVLSVDREFNPKPILKLECGYGLRHESQITT